jgi:tetratricopeptide (TPR) repeat protein
LFLAQISLAGVYIKLNRPDDTLQLLAHLRQGAPAAGLPNDAQMKMLEAEAWAYVLKGDLPRAERLLQDARTAFPKENEPFSVLANIYIGMGRQTNAVQAYTEQLRLQPRNVGAMVNLSALHIVLANYPEAISLLDEAVRLDPKSPAAIMNRAIAHLQAGHLPEAKKDYEMLLVLTPKPIPAVVYGLGEIAWLQKDYPEALKHYRHFVKIARPGAAELVTVRSRIQAIQSGTL